MIQLNKMNEIMLYYELLELEYEAIWYKEICMVENFDAVTLSKVASHGLYDQAPDNFIPWLGVE